MRTSPWVSYLTDIASIITNTIIVANNGLKKEHNNQTFDKVINVIFLRTSFSVMFCSIIYCHYHNNIIQLLTIDALNMM